jgi:hypothetical protein
MPRDECQNGHKPVDIEIQYNGTEIRLNAFCDACGYGLEATINDTDWDTVGDSTKEPSDEL